MPRSNATFTPRPTIPSTWTEDHTNAHLQPHRHAVARRAGALQRPEQGTGDDEASRVVSGALFNFFTANDTSDDDAQAITAMVIADQAHNLARHNPERAQPMSEMIEQHIAVGAMTGCFDLLTSKLG